MNATIKKILYAENENDMYLPNYSVMAKKCAKCSLVSYERIRDNILNMISNYLIEMKDIKSDLIKKKIETIISVCIDINKSLKFKKLDTINYDSIKRMVQYKLYLKKYYEKVLIKEGYEFIDPNVKDDIIEMMVY